MQFSLAIEENHTSLNLKALDVLKGDLKKLAVSIFNATPLSVFILHIPKFAIYKTPLGFFEKDLVLKGKPRPIQKDDLLSRFISFKSVRDIYFKKLVEEAIPQTDEILLQKIKEGDNSAFEIIMTKYKGALASYTKKKTKDKSSIDDIVQEAFIRLWNSRSTFDLSLPVFTFLTKAVNSIVIDFFRKEKAEKRPEIEFHSPEALIVNFDKEIEPEEPVDIVSSKEKIKRVWDTILLLPMPYRAILAFSDLENLTSDEIGFMFGLSPNTVRSQIITARGKFKSLYHE